MLNIDKLLTPSLFLNSEDIDSVFSALNENGNLKEGLDYLEHNADFPVNITSINRIIRLYIGSDELFNEYMVNNPNSLYTPFIIYHKFNNGYNDLLPYKELCSKYAYKLQLIDGFNSNNIFRELDSYNNDISKFNTFMMRVNARLLSNKMDFMWKIRLKLIAKSILSNSKYKDEVACLIRNMLNHYHYDEVAKDITNLIFKTIEDPDKRRSYNSIFLKDICSRLNQDQCTKLIDIVEELIDNDIISITELNRYNKAVLESKES